MTLNQLKSLIRKAGVQESKSGASGRVRGFHGSWSEGFDVTGFQPWKFQTVLKGQKVTHVNEAKTQTVTIKFRSARNEKSGFDKRSVAALSTIKNVLKSNGVKFTDKGDSLCVAVDNTLTQSDIDSAKAWLKTVQNS